MTSTTQTQQPRQRRRRGVILTPEGLEKLQEAKIEAEYLENKGRRFTLEDLSERTTLAMDTLMKVFAAEVGVDKQTLKCCFKAFNLTLESRDYERPNFQDNLDDLAQDNLLEIVEPELPEGQVPLNSAFYIERSSIESDCYKAILQPGALIRIKAPRRMGKSSLMMRILHQVSEKKYNYVFLSLQLADKPILQNLDKFLRWFCANVTLKLQLPNKIDDYWDDLFGSKICCKIYFEEYLLANLKQPLVLGLDDVDILFQYPDIADDFFALLRAWHEESKTRKIWQNIRLIVAHSSEVYIPINSNQSPFNVGIPVELPMLNYEQIFDLTQRYQLDFSRQEIEQIICLVGGHPYLIRLALYSIWNEDITLEELLTISPMSEDNIYRDHLKRQLYNLQQENSELAEIYAKLVMSKQPLEIDLLQSFKLQSLGLVVFQGKKVMPSCELYRQYFCIHFRGNQ
jgi:hypothetical protein